jgi:hypothetical protein
MRDDSNYSRDAVGTIVYSWLLPNTLHRRRRALAQKARFATVHLLRFPAITTAEQLALTDAPRGAMSWKIGPGGRVGPDGRRLPSDTWSGVGLFAELAEAEHAFQNKEAFMPFLAGAQESWHLLLRPFRHHGACNYIERETPGELFEVSEESCGGPLVVVTTAGYTLGFEANLDRVIAFRHKVDHVGNWMKDLEGCLISRAFTHHTVGYDGFTVSVWRSDEDMLCASYRAGAHRTYMDGHKASSDFDRSSFTRFRVVESSGAWDGRDPLTQPNLLTQ